MDQHLTQIAQLIDGSHYQEELILLDSKTAAQKIVEYLLSHFDVTEKR